MRACAPLVFALVAAATPARADDWLAVQPECGYGLEVREPGRTALLYPRVGLSAVVHAGDDLVARARVPSGLTPPPGIQQERALVGWSAELVGQSVALGAPAEHRYALPVVDVRPDGVSSLVYRATIPIPAWAAPGTYGLVVRAPGGEDAVAGAVRVLARGRAIRAAVFGGPAATADAHAATGEAALAALASMPIDVVFGPGDRSTLERLASAPLDASVPAYVALAEGGIPVALRTGNDLLVLGDCDGRDAHAVETEAERLAGHHELDVRPLARGALPAAGSLVRFDDAARAIRFTSSPIVTLEGGAVRIAGSRAPWELTVRVPDDGRSAATVEGASRAEIFPSTYLGAASSIPSLAIRVVAYRGGTAVVRLGEARPVELELAASPRVVPTGRPVTFTARGDRPLARVAWTFSDGETFVGEVVRRSFGPVETHEAHAMAIAEDGTAARARTSVEVQTREVRGGACGVASRSSGLVGPSFWLLAAVVLIRRARRGNRCPASDG